jgi:hypothetical protein
MSGNQSAAEALPIGCRGTFNCLAEYLEWDAAQSIFTEFKEPLPKERAYFIGAEDGPVKIGVTTNASQRLESLQTGCPYPVRLLAIIHAGRSLERAYHRYFDQHRLSGEWFDRCPDLESEIRYWSAKVRSA